MTLVLIVEVYILGSLFMIVDRYIPGSLCCRARLNVCMHALSCDAGPHAACKMAPLCLLQLYTVFRMSCGCSSPAVLNQEKRGI